MKRTASIFAALVMAVSSAYAQPNTKLRPDETVLLYSDSFDGNIDAVYGEKIIYAGFEMTEANGLAGSETLPANGNLGNISDLARCDLYFPKKTNGQMVIVCPGGGYGIVSSYNEGTYVADWFLSKGITVCVVKYRLPNGHWEVPLADVQNALRYCRAHAQEWGVDQIGVMGFSAGGHLAASATNLYVDDVTRPDFSILIYPVISLEHGITHEGTRSRLIGKDEIWNDKDVKVTEYEAAQNKHAELLKHYTLQNQITENTPTSFIAHCTDDTVVPVANSINYYMRLLDCKVPVEMHIFPKGGHGWGFSSEKFKGKGNDVFSYARPQFEASLERWLKDLRK